MKNAKKIAFRVDASVQIGTGHFMRCLTLADILQNRGAYVRFICRELPTYFCELLQVKGVALSSLDNKLIVPNSSGLAHSSWLGCSQEVDANDTLEAMSDMLWDWLIVDHYALDERWESKMRGASEQIMVIDDIADRKHDCDLLLDQNFYTDMEIRYNDKVPNHCQLLLGPRYALLRDEFRILREKIQPRKGSVKRLLVFFGGMDANNFTGQAIKALSEIEIKELLVDVVVGANHPCRAEIEKDCEKHGFVCYVQTDKMADLMAVADLAIGAGGSTVWERCCLGLPTITFCTAENQLDQVSHVALYGLVYAPDTPNDIRHALKHHVISLVENCAVRHCISFHGMQTVDGQGVRRVANFLGYNKITVRFAVEEDSESIYKWRNHPKIRGVSRQSEFIAWEHHAIWFESLLDDPDRILLIGEFDGRPVGVIRFDIDKEQAELSIYLVPEIQTAINGRDLLQCAENWLAKNRTEVEVIKAEVLGSNDRSHRFFSANGFSVESTLFFKRLH